MHKPPTTLLGLNTRMSTGDMEEKEQKVKQRAPVRYSNSKTHLDE